MLVDVHCHLDMCKDIAGIIERAKEKNVLIVSHGVKYESNRNVLEFGKKFDNVKACLGLYPIDALMMSDSGIGQEIEFIRENKDKIIGIGEIGIDLKESKDFEKQRENFIKMIKLAREIGKPIIVHSRNAEEKVIEILEREMAKRVIMHCFSGSIKLVKKIVENGWYLSIPGNVCYSEQMQLLVKNVPISSLLCETDSPFLHPERKRDNEPSNVIFSYEKIAEIKELSLKEVESKIWDNCRRIFGI